MKLFVDYDDTIMQSSIEAIKYLRNHGFMPDKDVKNSSINWELNDLVPSENILRWKYNQWFLDCEEGHIQYMLQDGKYLKDTKPMDNAIDVLRRLSNDMEIYIVTVGKIKNLQVKMEIIQELFPFVKGIITSTDFNKSLINMENYIFIDDRSDFLGHSNAKNKILFKYNGVERETNQNWEGPVITNWLEAEALLRNYRYYLPHNTGTYSGKYPAV